MNKSLLLVVPGADDESTGYPVVVDEHTTVADLLHAAHLDTDKWGLQVKHGTGVISLRSEDVVATHVQENDKVFAHPTDMIVALMV